VGGSDVARVDMLADMGEVGLSVAEFVSEDCRNVSATGGRDVQGSELI
jgi:hypothetical protein